MSAFEQRAAELGAINAYEADSAGRIYAKFENGEVLPTGLTVRSLAGRSDIPQGGLDMAIEAERGGFGG